MSVPNSTSRIAYIGNNSTVVPYTVGFYFFQSSDLVVIVTDSLGVNTTLALNTDYTVSGAGVETGGSILTVVAVPITSTVTIYRQVVADQQTQYEENDQFPASSHERALDKLTMICQQNARADSGAIRVQETDGDLDQLAKVSTSVVGFDGAGQPICYTPDALTTFLNLVTPPQFDRPQATFADAGARALAVPDYIGQIGTQQNTGGIYIATSLVAGGWTQFSVTPGPNSINTAALQDGILSADVTGRAKMADLFITLAKINTGIFTADATGRGKFAAGFVDSTLLAANVVRDNFPTGSVIQNAYGEYTANADITTAIPLDSSTPTSTEGVEIITVSITPTNASNLLRFQFLGTGVNSAATICVALFKDAGLSAIAAASSYSPTNTSPVPVVLSHSQAAGSTSAQTYRIRVGPSSGTIRMNGTASGPLFGVARSTLVVQEIKV